jgi:hypothetical protein
MMRKLLMTVTILVLAASPSAIAQTGSRNPSPNSSATDKQGPWPAPVGHRQPRVDEVPAESDLNSQNNREDAEINRKLRSICRGC